MLIRCCEIQRFYNTEECPKALRLPAHVTFAYFSLMGLSSETAISRPLFPG